MLLNSAFKLVSSIGFAEPCSPIHRPATLFATCLLSSALRPSYSLLTLSKVLALGQAHKEPHNLQQSALAQPNLFHISLLYDLVLKLPGPFTYPLLPGYP